MSAIAQGLVALGVGAVLALFALVGGVSAYTASTNGSGGGTSSAVVYDGS